jgi:hypothetical protein
VHVVAHLRQKRVSAALREPCHGGVVHYRRGNS